MENADFCCIDGERCFVQATLNIPVAGLAIPWTLSLWAEISQSDFSLFLGSYAHDSLSADPIHGVISNYLDAFPQASGSAVKVHLGSSEQRPSLTVIDRDSDIGLAQHVGLSEQELHKLLAVMGYDAAS